MDQLVLNEPHSGLHAIAALLPDQAPANVAWLRRVLAEAREVAAIHAMWTGPEISAPIAADSLPDELAREALPLENATVTPLAGDVVLTWLPARLWGGGPHPVFDVGLYYGPHARCLFPIGWQPGSVVARVADVTGLAACCWRIRQSGACRLSLSLA